jgi:hypothetical protein
VLDPQLLRDFMRGFFGYGHLGAKYWFVGLEEGGGTSIDEIRHRLETWDALGRPPVADLHEFHERAGITRWSVARPPLQSTWKQLIRVILTAEGQPSDLEAIRTYQRNLLGRRNGESTLIELMPLPSPSTAQWLYDSARLEMIRDRASYSAAILGERIAAIRELIAAHQPGIVVFYGLNRRDAWSSIAGRPLIDSDAGPFAFHSTPATLFLMTKHPVAWGAKNVEFEAAGRFVGRFGREV